MVSAAPLPGLLHGLFEHPVSDRNDEPRVFGQWNEIQRADRAAFGVQPADQRFGFVDFPSREVNDGLVIDLELLARQGGAQVTRETPTLFCRYLQVGCEVAEPIAPGVFRRI